MISTPCLPGRGEDFVHARSHLGHPARRTPTPVLIPHVADDDRRFGGIPGDLLGHRVKTGAAGFGFDSFADVQREGLSNGRGTVTRCVGEVARERHAHCGRHQDNLKPRPVGQKSLVKRRIQAPSHCPLRRLRWQPLPNPSRIKVRLSVERGRMLRLSVPLANLWFVALALLLICGPNRRLSGRSKMPMPVPPDHARQMADGLAIFTQHVRPVAHQAVPQMSRRRGGGPIRLQPGDSRRASGRRNVGQGRRAGQSGREPAVSADHARRRALHAAGRAQALATAEIAYDRRMDRPRRTV